MKSSEQIYISIDPQDYKKDKSLILNSQVDILNTIKHLQNLRKIKEDKTKLKSRLRDLSMQINTQIQSLQNKLPEVKIPKPKTEKIQEKIIRKLKSANQSIEHADIQRKHNSIDDELREIQEKLKTLNS